MSKKKTNEYINQLVASIENVADEFIDSNIPLAVKLQRIASNVAVAFLDNDLLIDNLDVGSETKKQIASLIREAVSNKTARKAAKRIKK